MSSILRKRSYVLALAVIMLSLVLNAGISAAQDEVPMLHGTVTDIDIKGKTVTIDVTTVGCTGVRTFRYHGLDKRKLEKGDWVQFFVDSESCNGVGSERIRDFWRIKK